MSESIDPLVLQTLRKCISIAIFSDETVNTLVQMLKIEGFDFAVDVDICVTPLSKPTFAQTGFTTQDSKFLKALRISPEN
jgi:hypothetical protein